MLWLIYILSLGDLFNIVRNFHDNTIERDNNIASEIVQGVQASKRNVGLVSVFGLGHVAVPQKVQNVLPELKTVTHMRPTAFQNFGKVLYDRMRVPGIMTKDFALKEYIKIWIFRNLGHLIGPEFYGHRFQDPALAINMGNLVDNVKSDVHLKEFAKMLSDLEEPDCNLSTRKLIDGMNFLEMMGASLYGSKDAFMSPIIATRSKIIQFQKENPELIEFL